ncbi:MAG: ABC transporter ATP-binding protein [Sphaerochaetaceae bacterium]|nr:ABC transporter ATP-binding protein [Sphaerochaetaceae bacterium]MDC7236503.1 ABC transporter ATP-binding protein [Sphaerochaetaceae bacterium]MDC7250160.1 ABC transporter ATP-binding protein [Sphaerochaetaceae bacterium]
MSVAINIQHALKAYGKNVIIPDLDVEIRDKEFFTLLGPSGCGKTTLLRMIAGFNTIEGGDFYFDENRINDLDPSRRNIGMVFQNYAIFPHLTVRENVEFGLKNRNFSKSEIGPMADKFLKLMQIYEYRDRMPERLSGGQQQRVALARALVIMPDVLLMDEPLSNLDAKLRLEMRQAIRDIQKEVGITTIYVTHDQEEAMAISDRIAVMNLGEIQQIGSPQEIYHRPSNEFVASFIGRTNIIKSECDKNEINILNHKVKFNNIDYKGRVKVSIRPEEFIITDDETAIPAVIKDTIFLGLNTHFFMELPNKQIVEIIKESMINNKNETGKTVYLTINTDKVNVFSEDGKENLVIAYEK